jgi:hypothetical protein
VVGDVGDGGKGLRRHLKKIVFLNFLLGQFCVVVKVVMMMMIHRKILARYGWVQPKYKTRKFKINFYILGYSS